MYEKNILKKYKRNLTYLEESHIYLTQKFKMMDLKLEGAIGMQSSKIDYSIV